MPSERRRYVRLVGIMQREKRRIESRQPLAIRVRLPVPSRLPGASLCLRRTTDSHRSSDDAAEEKKKQPGLRKTQKLSRALRKTPGWPDIDVDRRIYSTPLNFDSPMPMPPETNFSFRCCSISDVTRLCMPPSAILTYFHVIECIAK